MFSYYGSKSKVIDLYPAPKYAKIIEPFAGSARYALRYWDRDVLLVDKYEVIVKVWHYLQAASPADILGLPRLKEGERLRDFNLCDGARLLMGFLVGKGLEAPRDKATRWATTSRPNNINFQLRFIAGNLPKIKHWTIELGSYENIPNYEGTWFIDPPYQFGGHAYKENNKGWNYLTLSDWCKSRSGQVIVCENTKADWLPFFGIKKINGTQNTNTTEAMWCNDLSQPRLFSMPTPAMELV